LKQTKQRATPTFSAPRRECRGFKVERDLVGARGLFERIVEDGKVAGGVDEAYVGQARELLEILDQMEE
jgi:hypothetical protein